MSSNLALLPEPEPLRAVTVSRDVQEFDLLIEDMEAELGEGWGDLDFNETIAFLRQDEANALEFIVIAVDQDDEARLPQVAEIIKQAKSGAISIILVAEGLGPAAVHEMLRSGADDFVPYPLPEGALSEAIARIRSKAAGAAQAEANAEAAAAAGITTGGGAKSGDGALYALQSAAGGDGATTLAVNLAWEFANLSKTDAPSVCIIDLGLQFGSVSTYLDLPRKPVVFEILTDMESMDEQAFRQALETFKDKMNVFTAPSDVLPFDLVSPEDVKSLVTFARGCFDIVIVDMPNTVTAWTDTVLGEADIFFMVCQMEVRSAQNAMRFQKLLKAEGIPDERLSFLLNRAPGKMDMGGRGRIDKMAEGLGIKFHSILSDGGKQITEANDQAVPLREIAGRNALTKDIAKLAETLHEIRQSILAGEEVVPAGKKKAVFGLKFG